MDAGAVKTVVNEPLRRALCLGWLVALALAVLCGGASAATFRVHAVDDGSCGNATFDATASGVIAPLFRSVDATCASGAVEMAANAGTGFLGVLSKATNVAPVIPGGVFASAGARATTQFMVMGPAGTVPVSLNLSLDSKSSGSDGERQLSLFLGDFGWGIVRISPGGGVSRFGTIYLPDVDCWPCNLTSDTLMVPANTPLEFSMQIGVVAERLLEGPPGTTSVDALNTLTFPDGPVFNLPVG